MADARTSITDPLCINALSFNVPGLIGLTFCPGKKGESIHGRPWDRDLELDVQAIRAWNASVVITLMEEHELAELNVGRLGEAVEDCGMKWVHLPIVDVSIPDTSFNSIWADLTKDLQERLANGERVVLHCRGGLGRTGLIAALLLIDHGYGAEQAIQVVRKARPGAIETREQEDYLRSYRPYLSHACLLGGAIGDSLGADIEFVSLRTIRSRFPYGVDTLSRAYGDPTGGFTDDTQMTLFTAEGLIRGALRGNYKGVCHLPSVVHHALLRWLKTQGEEPRMEIDAEVGLIADKRMWVRAAPGNTCLGALRAAQQFGVPLKVENDSKGCGTIMRIAPIALCISPGSIRELAIETSALTHGHPVGQLAASAWAEMLSDVYNGGDMLTAAERVADEYTSIERDACPVIKAIQNALNAPRDGRPETVETLGGGWVAEEALSIALYACLASNGFEEGLQISVTHSGDTDSTGAIAGNMLGLMYPSQVFAHRWSEELSGRDLVARLALDLPWAPYWDEQSPDCIWSQYPGW